MLAGRCEWWCASMLHAAAEVYAPERLQLDVHSESRNVKPSRIIRDRCVCENQHGGQTDSAVFAVRVLAAKNAQFDLQTFN